MRVLYNANVSKLHDHTAAYISRVLHGELRSQSFICVALQRILEQRKTLSVRCSQWQDLMWYRYGSLVINHHKRFKSLHHYLVGRHIHIDGARQEISGIASQQVVEKFRTQDLRTQNN